MEGWRKRKQTRKDGKHTEIDERQGECSGERKYIKRINKKDGQTNLPNHELYYVVKRNGGDII